MLEYVIWDWNGTLMDDSEASLKAMNNVLDRYGLERLSHQKYMEIFTFPVVDYYKLAGFDLSVLSFEELSVAYVEEYKKLSPGCLLSAGAREALEGLRARGIEQILLSASETGELIKQSAALGVNTYFSHIIGADNIHAYGKLALASEFIKKQGYKGENGIFIGDTVHDYETALAAGCGCILYFSGHQSVDRLKKCGVPVMKNFEELEQILFRGGLC